MICGFLRGTPLVLKCFYSDCARSMICNGIVPDLICNPPCNVISITYPKVCVSLGNELSPLDVKDIPSVKWGAEPGCRYTLIMLDADIPSRKLPVYRPWLNWLVGNIQDNDIRGATPIADYVGPSPPKKTDLHRYVFLVYKQTSPLKFCIPYIPNMCATGRLQFDLYNFTTKYSLGDPIAGNFFLAKWDCYVETLNRRLGI